MQKKTMAELRASFKQATTPESRPSNYYPFYNIAFDEKAVVRFLPDANPNNSLGFLVEKLTHDLEIAGEKKTVPCLKMYGKECPICKHSAALYKADDKVNGKKFYRSKQHIGQALIVEDPIKYKEGETSAVGTVKLINVGFKLFNKINEAIDEELDEIPWDYEVGTDFNIKKTKQGEFANYESSKFAKRPRALTEDELAAIEGNTHDLSTFLPKEPSLEDVQKLLDAAINGGIPDDNDEEDDDDDVKKSTPVDSAQKSKPAIDTSSNESSEELEEADQILESIRRKRQQASNASSN